MGMHACSSEGEDEEPQEHEQHAATAQAAQAASASSRRQAGRGTDAAQAGRARGTEEGAAEAAGEVKAGVKVDACVLLCGLNDFKKVRASACLLTSSFPSESLPLSPSPTSSPTYAVRQRRLSPACALSPLSFSRKQT